MHCKADQKAFADLMNAMFLIKFLVFQIMDIEQRCKRVKKRTPNQDRELETYEKDYAKLLKRNAVG